MGKVLLGILCLFFPFAVLIRHRPSLKVPWTCLLQLPASIPSVIYGICHMTRD
jgi:ABC-type phosphate transport system permease subunit